MRREKTLTADEHAEFVEALSSHGYGPSRLERLFEARGWSVNLRTVESWYRPGKDRRSIPAEQAGRIEQVVTEPELKRKLKGLSERALREELRNGIADELEPGKDWQRLMIARLRAPGAPEETLRDDLAKQIKHLSGLLSRMARGRSSIEVTLFVLALAAIVALFWIWLTR